METDASKILATHASTIYRDNAGRIKFTYGKLIGEYPILMAETLVMESY